MGTRQSKIARRTTTSGINVSVTRKEQILDEVRSLPASERMEILEGVLELVMPSLSPEQEQGLLDAIGQADRGDLELELIDGPEAIAKQRRRLYATR
jgi:hypothetical protein